MATLSAVNDDRPESQGYRMKRLGKPLLRRVGSIERQGPTSRTLYDNKAERALNEPQGSNVRFFGGTFAEFGAWSLVSGR